MTSPEQSKEALDAQLVFAMQRACQYLTAEGAIDYAALPPERLGALHRVGAVQELAIQSDPHLQVDQWFEDEDTGERHLIMTSAELFYNSSNNFRVYFDEDSDIGLLYRKQAHARRFQALFPEFDAVLVEARRVFVAAQREAMIQRVQHKDDLFLNGLQAAYALMSQLVDEDDDAGLGKKVRESHNRHVMLTA